MRYGLLFATVFVGTLATGCGDDTSRGSGGSGGATGGAGAGGTAGGGGGQGGASGGEGGVGGMGGEGGMADCDAILQTISVTLDNAAACDPNIDMRQCTDTIMGLCCEVSVNPDNAANVAAFQSAVNDALAAGCDARACSLVDCAKVGVGTCSPTADGGQCRFE